MGNAENNERISFETMDTHDFKPQFPAYANVPVKRDVPVAHHLKGCKHLSQRIMVSVAVSSLSLVVAASGGHTELYFD